MARIRCLPHCAWLSPGTRAPVTIARWSGVVAIAPASSLSGSVVAPHALERVNAKLPLHCHRRLVARIARDGAIVQSVQASEADAVEQDLADEGHAIS